MTCILQLYSAVLRVSSGILNAKMLQLINAVEDDLVILFLAPAHQNTLEVEKPRDDSK